MKEVINLLESYEKNIHVAEECGITAEELWDTLYKPHLIAYMETVKKQAA